MFITNEIRKTDLNIAATTKVNWRQEGDFTPMSRHSGENEERNGVVFVLNKECGRDKDVGSGYCMVSFNTYVVTPAIIQIRMSFKSSQTLVAHV